VSNTFHISSGIVDTWLLVNVFLLTGMPLMICLH
jgi:hypothetical protein